MLGSVYVQHDINIHNGIVLPAKTAYPYYAIEDHTPDHDIPNGVIQPWVCYKVMVGDSYKYVLKDLCYEVDLVPDLVRKTPEDVADELRGDSNDVAPLYKEYFNIDMKRSYTPDYDYSPELLRALRQKHQPDEEPESTEEETSIGGGEWV